MKKAKRFGGGFDIAGTVKKAVLLHQAKHFDEAEKIYRQVLKAQPNNFDCLHLLGVIHYQRGNHAAAVSQIDAALRVQPNVSDAFNNRGNA
ncbi:MAG TPA: tetratricopeptide repeat protein, partial [Micropepsaceae bacterium]|nr:tetratricopeptide repeat protein [Micropepsaceae bacterium]